MMTRMLEYAMNTPLIQYMQGRIYDEKVMLLPYHTTCNKSVPKMINSLNKWDSCYNMVGVTQVFLMLGLQQVPRRW